MNKNDLRAKLEKSVAELERALKFQKKAEQDSFYLKGIAKSYEVCFEYAWKFLQKKINDEGLEAYSPRETIKLAGRVGIIDNVERWLNFLQDRNFAVHDYLGLPDEEYLRTIRAFYREIRVLASRSKRQA